MRCRCCQTQLSRLLKTFCDLNALDSIAKLAVGYLLDELKNDITRETPASFEPSIDYVVTKIPRFAFEKFPQARAPSANPNGIQIHQPRVGGPRRTGEERLPWETVPQIHQL